MTEPKKSATTNIYEIRISSHLSESWADWFDGFEIMPEQDGTTTLSGEIIDQSALHGLLKRVRDLGLPLLSVNQINKENQDEI